MLERRRSELVRKAEKAVRREEGEINGRGKGRGRLVNRKMLERMGEEEDVETTFFSGRRPCLVSRRKRESGEPRRGCEPLISLLISSTSAPSIPHPTVEPIITINLKSR